MTALEAARALADATQCLIAHDRAERPCGAVEECAKALAAFREADKGTDYVLAGPAGSCPYCKAGTLHAAATCFDYDLNTRTPKPTAVVEAGGEGATVTDDEIDEALRLARAASPEPWPVSAWLNTDEGGWAARGPHHECPNDGSSCEPGDPQHRRAMADAAFIAAARTLVPRLALALREARRERDESICNANHPEHWLRRARELEKELFRKAAEITEIEDARDEAVELLRPFAKLGDAYHPTRSDTEPVVRVGSKGRPGITVGDLHRAAAFLRGREPKP